MQSNKDKPFRYFSFPYIQIFLCFAGYDRIIVSMAKGIKFDSSNNLSFLRCCFIKILTYACSTMLYLKSLIDEEFFVIFWKSS